jgi:glycosyltransferase involved in cell wall biosynthesis
MKVSIVAPVKNEAAFIGYSVMAVLDHVHEIIYTCAGSNDGTDEILDKIKAVYAGDKLKLLRKPGYDFNTKDMFAYNAAYNDAIEAATGDAVFYLHPDMIVLNPEIIPYLPEKGLAWYTNLASYAGDMRTVITKGRDTAWKNIHRKKFGLHYFGAYGSQNEDFYFKDITGRAHVHHGKAFRQYPYTVLDSGLRVNHYCEAKEYSRRFEKMKSCLRNLFPHWTESFVVEEAAQHPRVTLTPSSERWGVFEFQPAEAPEPFVFQKYREEFKKITEAVA